MSIPLDKIVVKHMFRFAAAKMRALYLPIMDQMKVRDNCMWYWHPKNNLMLHVLQTGNYDEYNEYIYLCNHKEHSRENFERLVSEFDLSKMEPIEVSWNGQYFVVNNGAHRLAILMYKGIITDSIPTQYIRNNGKEILPWDFNPQELIQQATIKKVSDLLSSTVGYSFQNGWNNRTRHGYHSFTIKNMSLIGQRHCVKRLDKMRSVYDFKGKKVVDLGCNTGGMIMHLNECQRGVGVDFDSKAIEVANNVRDELIGHVPVCEFKVMNLEKDDVKGLLQKETPDIVFVLSMGSWINWKKVYQEIHETCNRVFLEINNNEEGQPQLDFFAGNGWRSVEVSSSSDDDTTGNFNRRLFFLER
jgi:SAM-dependent methyltransferase